MSSKAVSYYDWSLGFKKILTPISNEDSLISNEKNSLGLSKNAFNEFLKNWKEVNL